MASDIFTRRKFEWLQTVMHDGKLSASARLVCYEIARHLNKVSGDAWPSEETVARNLGITVRTVERAIAQLDGRPFDNLGRPTRVAYIATTLNGRSNNYIPNFSVIPDKLSGVPSPKPDKNDRNTRQFRQETPDKKGGLSLLSKPFQVTGSALPNLRNDVEVVAHVEDRWPSVKRRLENRFGLDVAASWFEELTIESLSGDEVTLGAPTRFIAHRIKSEYLASIEREWHAAHPHAPAARLRVVVRGQRASE